MTKRKARAAQPTPHVCGRALLAILVLVTKLNLGPQTLFLLKGSALRKMMVSPVTFVCSAAQTSKMILVSRPGVTICATDFSVSIAA
mmetsp:Transcript_7554/g.14206  ORF Transcript_7554/g.14206 Transcript_7554/m.14206 type:complete len:87 (+) Transcript_7554:335-595(+)